MATSPEMFTLTSSQISPHQEANPHTPPEKMKAASDPRRVYVLGVGSIGILVAHSLMRLDDPPAITLMLHRAGSAEKFGLASNVLLLVDKETGVAQGSSGYDLAVLHTRRGCHNKSWAQTNEATFRDSMSGLTLDSVEEFIPSLIIACKGPATVSAVQSVKHRVNAETTICLMQNGMGQVEELNEKVFTNPNERPAYILGIISHGLYLTAAFTAVHAGRGAIALSPSPNNDLSKARDIKPPAVGNASSSHLLKLLVQAPNLNAAFYPPNELLQLQLEKLVVNSVMNPLTALLDIPNGQLLHNRPLSTLSRDLIAEASTIICALPGLKDTPGIHKRFSPEKLLERVKNVTELTAGNSSSMREDVRNKKGTEIEYINGWLVRQAEALGMKCDVNKSLVQLIKGKTFAGEKEVTAG